MTDYRQWLDSLRYALRHPRIRMTMRTNIAVAAVALVVAGFYWWPARHAHRDLVEQVDAKRRAVVEASQAEEVAQAYRRALRELPMLEKKLDASVRQAELVDTLGRLARQRGVKILSESYEEGKERDGYASLTLDLALQGSYPAVREFLAALPALPVWVEIEEARLERAREAAGQIRAQLRLVVYRKAAASKAGAS